MIVHVGYCGRTMERLRYPDDPREFHLEISQECAEKLLDACNGHPDAAQVGSAIEQLERVLADALNALGEQDDDVR